MKIIADDAGRDLSKEERSFIKNVFNQADVSRMKYLGTSGIKIDSSQTDFHDLCSVYSCLPEEKATKVF